MKKRNLVYVIIVCVAIFFSMSRAYAGGVNDPRHGFDPRSYSRSYSDSYSQSTAKALGVGIGQGGNAAVSNSVKGGEGGQGGANNLDMRGANNNTWNYPQQTPMAWSPPVYSANPCVKGYSAGGSAAPVGISLGFQLSDEECNRRADSIRWSEMQMAPVGCQRMLIDSPENKEALKASGMACSQAQSIAVAVPAPVPPVVSTPALDQWWNEKQRDLDKKLDNAHRLGVVK